MILFDSIIQAPGLMKIKSSMILHIRAHIKLFTEREEKITLT